MKQLAFFLGLGLLAAAILFAFRAQIYGMMAGAPDLGPSQLETLVRPDSPNHHLIADADMTSAAVDGPAAMIAQHPRTVMGEIDRIFEATGRAENVATTPEGTYARYVVRTRLMRYPDTVEVWAFQVGRTDETKLAIYSRSQIGYSDLGANKARVESLVATLKDRLEAQ